MAEWTAVASPALPAKMPMEFEEQPVDARVQFQPEKGTGILTSMASDEIIHYNVNNLLLRDKQKDQLEAFYKVSCVRGTISFTWNEPWRGAGVVTFRFLTRPAYTLLVPAIFRSEASPSETPYGQYQRLWHASFRLVRAPWFPA